MMRVALWLSAAFVLLGLVLASGVAHCQPVDTRVVSELAEVRAEVRGLRDSVSRLVAAAERAADRQPVYRTDLDPLRAEARAQVTEARAEIRAQHLRLVSLEEARWYLLGALALGAVVLGLLARDVRLQLRLAGGRAEAPSPKAE